MGEDAAYANMWLSTTQNTSLMSTLSCVWIGEAPSYTELVYTGLES